MHTDHYHFSQLDESTLKDVQALEKELGVTLVAMEPDPDPAQLSEAQLQSIQALEKKTGKVLVAYA